MNFGCTACGRCCHGLRLTLTIAEAIRWIERGGTVDILCDGLPVGSQQVEDLRSERVFGASSGTVEIGIDLMLVATFDSACPNLRSDMRCGIYDERPMVCRVYPAELTPGRIIDPASRRCPPEAWGADQPLFATEEGMILDEETRGPMHRLRHELASDAGMKGAIAATLGVAVTALHNEGYAVWSLPQAALLDALRAISDRRDIVSAPPAQWSFSSNRASTRDLIAAAGATSASRGENQGLGYLPFFDDA